MDCGNHLEVFKKQDMVEKKRKETFLREAEQGCALSFSLPTYSWRGFVRAQLNRQRTLWHQLSSQAAAISHPSSSRNRCHDVGSDSKADAQPTGKGLTTTPILSFRNFAALCCRQMQLAMFREKKKKVGSGVTIKKSNSNSIPSSSKSSLTTRQQQQLKCLRSFRGCAAVVGTSILLDGEHVEALQYLQSLTVAAHERRRRRRMQQNETKSKAQLALEWRNPKKRRERRKKKKEKGAEMKKHEGVREERHILVGRSSGRRRKRKLKEGLINSDDASVCRNSYITTKKRRKERAMVMKKDTYSQERRKNKTRAIMKTEEVLMMTSDNGPDDAQPREKKTGGGSIDSVSLSFKREGLGADDNQPAAETAPISQTPASRTATLRTCGTPMVMRRALETPRMEDAVNHSKDDECGGNKSDGGAESAELCAEVRDSLVHHACGDKEEDGGCEGVSLFHHHHCEVVVEKKKEKKNKNEDKNKKRKNKENNGSGMGEEQNEMTSNKRKSKTETAMAMKCSYPSARSQVPSLVDFVACLRSAHNDDDDDDDDHHHLHNRAEVSAAEEGGRKKTKEGMAPLLQRNACWRELHQHVMTLR